MEPNKIKNKKGKSKTLRLNKDLVQPLKIDAVDCIGAYIKQIRQYRVPTPEEENAMIREYKRTGDVNIRNRIVMCHQGFIYSAAKRYSTDYDTVLDLISEGNCGLIEAIEKYDPNSYDNRLLSYAQAYIGKYMRLYVSRLNPIQRSADIKFGSSISKERDTFYAKNGRYPSNIEIKIAMEEKYNISLSDADLEMSNFISLDDLSFMEKCDKDDPNFVPMSMSQDMIDRVSTENSYMGVIEADGIHDIITTAIGHLSEREADVIKMLYGIGYDYAYDPDLIADKYNITRTRIMQIQKDALLKMKDVGNKF